MFTFPIIDKLGGRDAVAALIRRPRAVERGVTPDAVRMWISRDSMPGYAIRQLYEEAERRAIPVSAADFQRVQRGTDHAAE